MTTAFFGELMLRLSPPGRELLLQTPKLEVNIGGAEANVATGLACLGHATRMISAVADNPLGAIDEVETLLHPESRVPEQSLVSDRSGRTTDRNGSGRQASDPDTTQHAHEATMFAAEIAATLAKARTQARYGTLVIAAPPAFLGVLRKALDAGGKP